MPGNWEVPDTIILKIFEKNPEKLCNINRRFHGLFLEYFCNSLIKMLDPYNNLKQKLKNFEKFVIKIIPRNILVHTFATHEKQLGRTWLYFNGKWNFCHDEIILFDFLESKIRELVPRERLNEFINNFPYIKIFWNGLQNWYRDDQFITKMDRNLNLLGFNNGIYNLKNGLFRKENWNDYSSLSVGYDYSLEEDKEYEEEINKFMEQLFPNKEIRDYVWQLSASLLFGNSFSKSLQYPCLHIFWGSGCNGKSSFLECLKEVLGDYMSIGDPNLIINSGYSSSSLARSRSRANQMRRRCISFRELSKYESINIGHLKTIISSDPILVPIGYFQFHFQTILTCDPINIPQDACLWSELRIVPFTRKFVKNPDMDKNELLQAHDVGERFSTLKWKQTFMKLLLERVTIFLKHGLQETEEIRNYTINFKNSY